MQKVRRGLVVVKVAAPGCKAGNGFELRLVHCLTDKIDKKGVCCDAMWELHRKGVPVQCVRLWRGWLSVQRLLEWGTVLDGELCPFSAQPTEATLANLDAVVRGGRGGRRAGRVGKDDLRTPTVHLGAGQPLYWTVRERDMKKVPPSIDIALCGIPQPTRWSGVCWWGALSFALSTSPALLRLMKEYLPSELVQLLPQVPRDPGASETLRAELFRRYHIGNDPGQDPREDGANGYNELLRLCTQLKLPFCSRVWTGDKLVVPAANSRLSAGCAPEKAVLLGVRTPRDQPGRPPLRLLLGGRFWRLRAVLQGSRLCGHQTSIVQLPGGYWAIHDTDWCTQGVGPLHHMGPPGDCDNGRFFWASLRSLVLINNKREGSSFCYVNGGNDDTAAVMREAAAQTGAAPAGRGSGPLDVEVEGLYTLEEPSD